MKRYSVRLTPEARADLRSIHDSIAMLSGYPAVARGYVNRIRDFLSSFETFPERGTVRSDQREGLRIIGFERSASVAFIVGRIPSSSFESCIADRNPDEAIPPASRRGICEAGEGRRGCSVQPA